MKWLLYPISFICVLVFYILVRPTIIAQRPPEAEVVVSNLSLNYVLAFVVVGALGPYISFKIFPKNKIMPTCITLMMVVCLYFLLKLTGVNMRW